MTLRPTAVLLISMWLLRATPGHAQARNAGAETLFQQGVALMNDQRTTEACAKFEGSQSLDPALGTLLRLGDCYDRIGKTASAWTTFQDAVSLARNRREPDRQQIAHERVTDLEQRLSWVRIQLAASELSRDASLRIDAAAVSLALLESPIPFDPGVHQIELSAPGRRTWSSHFEVARGPAQQSVTLPELELMPSPTVLAAAAPRPVDRAPPPEPPGASWRPWGIAVGVLGGIGLAVGGVLSYRALRIDRDSSAECNAQDLCTKAGVELRESAIAYANGATLSMIAGGVLLAGGIGLIVWSPSAADQTTAGGEPTGPVRLSAAVSETGARLGLEGAW